MLMVIYLLIFTRFKKDDAEFQFRLSRDRYLRSENFELLVSNLAPFFCCIREVCDLARIMVQHVFMRLLRWSQSLAPAPLPVRREATLWQKNVEGLRVGGWALFYLLMKNSAALDCLQKKGRKKKGVFEKSKTSQPLDSQAKEIATIFQQRLTAQTCCLKQLNKKLSAGFLEWYDCSSGRGLTYPSSAMLFVIVKIMDKLHKYMNATQVTPSLCKDVFANTSTDLELKAGWDLVMVHKPDSDRMKVFIESKRLRLISLLLHAKVGEMIYLTNLPHEHTHGSLRAGIKVLAVTEPRSVKKRKTIPV